MGSYTFKWDHPAEEVYVTGTFDNWSKSVKLEKDTSSFTKTVEIPEIDGKVQYKFVADGDWKHDHTAKTETDHEGNINNVIYPQDLKPSLSSAAMSSTGPEATTTGLAGAQPVEDKHLPGEFPETPAAATPATEDAFSVNPIPASSGTGNPVALAAGDKVPESSTLHNNTITSGVHDDPELKAKDAINTYGVTPIPATGGTGNPIHLQPGEEVPHHSTITSNTIDSNVKLDKESYEKSDSGAPQLPPVLTPGGEKEANGTKAVFGLGPAIGNPVIPESSLPMGENAVTDLGPNVSSVAPQSTTNELAGQQPILPRGVPAVVGESQNDAHTSPEAAANPEAVQDKSALENELKNKVSESPAAAQSGSVPQVVEESQETAHVDPEAADNAEAVDEKATVEDELKEKVPEAPATTESGLLGNSERGVTGAIAGGAVAAGTTAAAGAAATAYALRQKATEATGKDPVAEAPKSVQDSLPEKVAGGATTSAHTDAAGLPINPAEVPNTVEESQEKAHVGPEASGNPEAVVEKADVEDELKQKVPEAPATAESGLLGKSENNKGVVGAVAGGAAAAAAGAYAVNNKVTESTGTDAMAKLPKSVQDSINNMNSKGTTAPASVGPVATPTTAISQDPTLPQQAAVGEPVSVPAGEVQPEVASGVPEEVVNSQKEAHVSPEAAANPEAVHEKQAMEKELQSSLKPVEASGTPAPTVTAATTAVAPATSASGAPQLGDPTAVSPISMENTKPSTDAAVATTAGGVGAATAAAVGTTAITDKTNSSEPTTGSKELNASADTPAKTALQEEKLAAPEPKTPLDSRDVSPMSRVATKNHPEGTEEGPIVTDGVTSDSVPAESKPADETSAAAATTSAPVGSRPAAANSNKEKRQSFMDRVKGTPESTKTTGAASGTDSQKSKRRSLFGRIKDKLSSNVSAKHSTRLPRQYMGRRSMTENESVGESQSESQSDSQSESHSASETSSDPALNERIAAADRNRRASEMRMRALAGGSNPVTSQRILREASEASSSGIGPVPPPPALRENAGPSGNVDKGKNAVRTGGYGPQGHNGAALGQSESGIAQEDEGARRATGSAHPFVVRHFDQEQPVPMQPGPSQPRKPGNIAAGSEDDTINPGQNALDMLDRLSKPSSWIRSSIPSGSVRSSVVGSTSASEGPQDNPGTDALEALRRLSQTPVPNLRSAAATNATTEPESPTSPTSPTSLAMSRQDSSTPRAIFDASVPGNGKPPPVPPRNPNRSPPVQGPIQRPFPTSPEQDWLAVQRRLERSSRSNDWHEVLEDIPES